MQFEVHTAKETSTIFNAFKNKTGMFIAAPFTVMNVYCSEVTEAT